MIVASASTPAQSPIHGCTVLACAAVPHTMRKAVASASSSFIEPSLSFLLLSSLLPSLNLGCLGCSGCNYACESIVAVGLLNLGRRETSMQIDQRTFVARWARVTLLASSNALDDAGCLTPIDQHEGNLWVASCQRCPLLRGALYFRRPACFAHGIPQQPWVGSRTMPPTDGVRYGAPAIVSFEMTALVH